MIPIRDLNPTRRPPVVTYVLIALNVVVWLYEWHLGPYLQYFIMKWGVVPYYLTHGSGLGSWLTPFTSMFMHGGWMHLLGNMWFLHVFGDNIEDELGHARYAIFYLVCGLVAVALQVAMGPSSRVPMIGASGAIAGVLGGYTMIHPRARVVTLIPIFIFFQFVELPAFIFLFVWFGYQLLMGMTSLGASGGGGVAFFAHIGGFVAGLLLVRAMRLRPEPQRPVRPELRRAPRDWRAAPWD